MNQGQIVFLQSHEIPIGSWWEAADGGSYGYTVVSVDLKTGLATVISTFGHTNTIDSFKLQYRYSRVIPNEIRS